MPQQSGGHVITDDFVSASAPQFPYSDAAVQRAGSHVIITVENTQDRSIAIPIEDIELTPSGRSFWEFRKTLGEAGRPNTLQTLRAFDLTRNDYVELRWTKRSADSRLSSKPTDTCTGDASKTSDVLTIPGKAQRRLVLGFECNNYARAELAIPFVFPNGARKTYVWELTEIVPSRYKKGNKPK